MKCETCLHFKNLGNNIQGIGECRRYPPSVSLIAIPDPISGKASPKPISHWPPVRRNHYCGEYTPIIDT